MTPMHAWLGQNAYSQWAAKLATSTGADFERALLPLLRLFWPTLTQVPSTKAWDRKGVDLLVWSDNGPLPCVVQCKGFEVQEPGADQARAVEESVKTFLSSGLKAETYVLAHNRDGRFRELDARAKAAVAEIQRLGRARRVEVWDRQTLLQRAFDRLVELLEAALHRHSQELLRHFEGLFQFGGIWIREVPVDLEELRFERERPSERTTLPSSAQYDLRRLLTASSGRRWTIVTGIFGVGKSSAVLRAAATAGTVVVLPTSAVPEDVFRSGSTNRLLARVLEMIAWLEDLADEDRARLQQASATALAYVLRSGADQWVFVLDALDEHRVFGSLEGVQRLANQLAEFNCPVVLTTRREHFELSFGNLSAALGGLAPKYGKSRIATVVHLQRWSWRETAALIEAAAGSADPASALRIRALLALGETKATEIYGDVLYHPLFLQFLLEDAAEKGVRPRSRVDLLQAWIERKLRRDRISWVPTGVTQRAEVREGLDIDDFVPMMMEMMERVAFAMTARGTDARMEVLESLEAVTARTIAAQIFSGPTPQLLPLLLNSLLVIHERRPGGNHRIGFALRVIQEFFLASHFKRHILDPRDLPDSVQMLHRELIASYR